MSKIHHVNPNDIKFNGFIPNSSREVLYQKRRLESEGQIEPLLGEDQGDGTWTVDNIDWPYQYAQVLAARELEWETLLITDETEDERY
jgi:hypothetical protein